MRIKIECETKHEHLPLEYRRKFISFLKNAIESYNKDIFSNIYGSGNPKSFCFGIYFLPDVKVSKNGVMLHSKRFNVWITTRDLLMGVHLINAFMGRINKWVPFGDNDVKVTSIVKAEEFNIINNFAPFRTLSPIVVRDHNQETGKDWYFIFGDDQFEEVWKRNLKTEVKDVFNWDPSDDIDRMRIKPIKLRKTVVLNYGIYIPCTIGSFVLEGERYLLEYLHKAGCGSKRSLGFGCLDLI
jgi:CRISPR-associated endoribonuclease Cas6